MGPKEMLLKVLRELADNQFNLENNGLVGLPLVPGTSWCEPCCNIFLGAPGGEQICKGNHV